MNQFGRRGFGGGLSLFPPVIKFLLITNVIVFLVEWLFLSQIFMAGKPLSYYFSQYFALHTSNYSFSFSEPSFWPWQLISFQFMHGGLWHLFFNMFAIWMFGIELENIWGSKKFLIYYLLTGIGAGLTQMLVAPSVPTVGASGGVFGILIAFGMTFPERRIFIFPIFIPIKAKIFVAIYGVLELILGVSNAGDGIAHFAHVGGAIAGLFLIKFGEQFGIYKFFSELLGSFGQEKSNYSSGSFGSGDSGGFGSSSAFGSSQQKEAKRYKISWDNDDTEEYEEVEQENQKTYVVDGEEITQNRIDEILDKISETGYQNLSTKEKRILNELSRKL